MFTTSVLGSNMEEEVPSGSDNIVTEFNTYEDFLDSQITSLDLYYLEVSLFCHSLSRTSNITMGAPTNLKSLFCLNDESGSNPQLQAGGNCFKTVF